jgi:hypothetical protein
VICKRHRIQEGHITVACDGLSAIRKSLDRDSHFSTRSAQFDLLSAIDTSVRALPINVSWRHVLGSSSTRSPRLARHSHHRETRLSFFHRPQTSTRLFSSNLHKMWAPFQASPSLQASSPPDNGPTPTATSTDHRPRNP